MRSAYTVAWPRPLVETTLAEFLLRAMEDGTGSAAVTSAMVKIDRVLSTSPIDAGESRDGGERIVFESPLGVTYRVRESERVVEVVLVHYLPRHFPK